MPSLRNGWSRQAVELLENADIAIGVIDEAALARHGWLAAEAAIGIERRQHGDGDSGLIGGGKAAQGEFRWVGIGRPIRLVVEILELADDREAALEHLDIELGGDGLQILRAEAQREAVHDFSPGPETVGPRTGAFRQAGHQSLMGMGVNIGHGGERDARHSRLARLAGVDANDHAGGIDLDRHILCHPDGSNAVEK